MLLHHTRSGSGEPLVLVHGTGSYGRAWDAVVPALAHERDVFAIDLPGFGVSAPLPQSEPRTAARYAEAVAAFMDAKGLDRPHVAGFSLGGGIALELAAAGRVASATAISPTGFWTDGEAAWVRRSLTFAHGLLSRAGSRLYPLMRTRPGRVVLFGQLFGRPWRLSPDDAIAASANLVASPDTVPVIEQGLRGRFTAPIAPEVPVTIAWGPRDYLMRPRQGRRALEQIAHARWVDLPGCGHAPMTDDPELVARVLLEGSGTATP